MPHKLIITRAGIEERKSLEARNPASARRRSITDQTHERKRISLQTGSRLGLGEWDELRAIW